MEPTNMPITHKTDGLAGVYRAFDYSRDPGVLVSVLTGVDAGGVVHVLEEESLVMPASDSLVRKLVKLEVHTQWHQLRDRLKYGRAYIGFSVPKLDSL